MVSRIERTLKCARARLRRLSAREVPNAVARGAILVDIRPAAQRAAEGPVPTALVIERNVLEWRCDPTSEARLPQAVDDDVEWVVICSQGYTSSLAAAALQDLGLRRATDVAGGYQELARVGVLAGLQPTDSADPSERVENPVQELPGPLVCGRPDDLVGRALLEYHPAVDEQHLVGYLSGELDLVGDDHHRPTLGGEIADDREHLTD